MDIIQTPSGLLDEAREKWLDGGVFGELPDDPPRPARMSETELRQWAREQYDKPNHGVRTIIVRTFKEPESHAGAVALFVTRFFVELSETEAYAWLVYGELRKEDDGGSLSLGSFAVGPFDERFGQVGFTHTHRRALSLPRFREAAEAELDRVARWEDFQERSDLPDAFFDRAAGKAAVEAIGVPPAPRRRGNPGKPREMFEFAVEWQLAYRRKKENPAERGVLAQLEQRFPELKSRDGIRYRRDRAEALDFLGSGKRGSGQRNLGTAFVPFWNTLEDGDELKERARPLVEGRLPTRDQPRRRRRGFLGSTTPRQAGERKGQQ